MKWIAASIAALAVSVLVAAAWIGGELHKQGCIEKVEAQVPIAYSDAKQTVSFGSPGFRVWRNAVEIREAQIANCSRWP